MSVVAEFTIPAEALPGGDTLTEMPDVRIELDRIVPTEQSALPFFWIWGDRPVEFMERASREPNLARVELLAEVEHGALYRAEWSPDSAIVDGIKRLDAVIIEAVGTARHWRFQVRTQKHSSFNDFQAVFGEQDVPVRLVRLYDLAEFLEGGGRSVTPEQRETLLRAYREGYYADPRETTQEELGDHFGISHRAVSDRLRRGTRNLIMSALLSSDPQS